MAQILKNNVSGVLGLALSASGTSMTLLDASNFPTPTGGDFYLLTLIGLNANGQEASWEIVKVTGKASNTLTVVRAQEGTPAAAWPVATTVQLRLTAGSVVTPGTVSDHVGSGGSAHAAATTSTAGFMSAADKAKLDGVAAGATANASDAQLRDRSTHTGTQAISTVTGLQTALDGKQATLVSGTSIKTINGASVLGAGDLVVGDLVVGAGAGQVPIGGAIFAPFTSPDYVDGSGTGWVRTGFPVPIKQSQVDALNPVFPVNYVAFEQRTIPNPDGSTWISFAYGNGVFVGLTYGNNIAATSPDGITWTQRTLPVSSNWNSVTYGNGRFVAVASKKIAATSPDGITWTEIAIPPLTGGSPKITYGPQGFVYVMYGSNSAGFSPDGLTWVTKGLPTSSFTGMAYGNGLYLAFGYGSIIATSSDPASATSVSFGSPATQGNLPMFVRYL